MNQPQVLSRRRLWWEIGIVLALSVGRSALYSVLALIRALQREESLGDQQTQLNPSANAEQFWDVLYQFLAIFFALAPIALAIYLLWEPGSNALHRIGLDFRRFGGDLGRGILLFLVIGVPGLALYAAGRALGITLQVDASPLDPSWWTVPLLVLAALRAGLTEEVIFIAYLFDRLRRLGWSWWTIILSTAALRAAYHAYQGFGAIIGNFVMGLVFGWCYRRWGRVMPLVIAHMLLDIVAFVGYPLAAALWPDVFAPPDLADPVPHTLTVADRYFVGQRMPRPAASAPRPAGPPAHPLPARLQRRTETAATTCRLGAPVRSRNGGGGGRAPAHGRKAVSHPRMRRPGIPLWRADAQSRRVVTKRALSDVVPAPITLLARGDAPHTDRAVRTGQLVAVMRGVYADSAAWRALKPWERYLARVHAAALKYPEAAFVYESGAALRGLTVFLEPAEVHVVLPSGATSRVLSGVRTHTAARMPAVEEVGGLVVATPAEIVVDIARARHNAIGFAVAGSAMRADPLLTAHQLVELNASRPSTRGRRHALWALDRATSTPESPLEYISAAAIEWLGFPVPELQKWILGPPDEEADRLDFWWESWRVAGEADGEVKYSGELGDARTALRQRGVRDARLLDRGVQATAHWGWPDAIAAKPLRAALLAAGLPPERPENTLQLRSLQRVLAPSTARLRSANLPTARLH